MEPHCGRFIYRMITFDHLNAIYHRNLGFDIAIIPIHSMMLEMLQLII